MPSLTFSGTLPNLNKSLSSHQIDRLDGDRRTSWLSVPAVVSDMSRYKNESKLKIRN
ncbi:MAG: hypothetical protein K2K83_04790 [Rikenella sp.]|nr:hypothetical protein [Rikenella sp.]